jgi:acyl-coenzyme A thioesterase PaaI-like protein
MPGSRTADAEAASPGRELVFPSPGLCFGCSRTNPRGLALRFVERGQTVCCETVVASEYQGAPGVVHGGIQAVLLDETSCAAAFRATGGHVVTGTLMLRYLRPCPVERALRIEARTIADDGRALTVGAEIHDAVSGELLTRAEGRFHRTLRPGPDGGGVATA